MNTTTTTARNYKRWSTLRPPRYETAEQRVERIYRADGGPLIGWLTDEARLRKQGLKAMSTHLGATYGYIHQLQTGMRSVAKISHSFATSCALYLNVQVIVVKVLAGCVPLSDFAAPQVTEMEIVDRAIAAMVNDEKVRHKLPDSPLLLPPEYKKLLVLMYASKCGIDIFERQAVSSVLCSLMPQSSTAGEHPDGGCRQTGEEAKCASPEAAWGVTVSALCSRKRS